MALTKSQKESVVDEVTKLLNESKMTVIAKYQGLNVKALQNLRRQALGNDTRVKIIKNRLVKQALKQSSSLKDINTDPLEGMLLYAFNPVDEVAAAQVLNGFAKQNPSLEFIGAINVQGEFLEASRVKELALLPAKNQIVAGLINSLNSPLQAITRSLSRNLNGLLSALETKASN